jgi:hypothetical protein
MAKRMSPDISTEAPTDNLVGSLSDFFRSPRLGTTAFVAGTGFDSLLSRLASRPGNQKVKAPPKRDLYFFVAGTGFEPATSGL